MPMPAPAVPRPRSETVISVLPDQKFDLCGRRGFSAKLGASGVIIRSEDRAIPGRTFRGYERILSPGSSTELWPGCTVAVSTRTLAGVEQMVFKTAKEP